VEVPSQAETSEEESSKEEEEGRRQESEDEELPDLTSVVAVYKGQWFFG
jgi:hypothetical protein